MSNKLTNDARKAIAKRVLAHRFDADEKALKERFFDFAEEVYNASYPRAVQKQMAAMPEGFMPASGTIIFCVKEAKRVSYSQDLKMRHWQPISNKARHGGAILTVDVDSELSTKLLALNQAQSAFNAQVTVATSELTSALASYTTFDKLLKGWPEVKPFVDMPESQSRLMPVVQTEKLNETFKLPVKTLKSSKRKRAQPNCEVAA